MLQISERGLQMPLSPIRKLVPYAEAAKQKGIHVFHLNIGQPDIETPPLMLDAIRNTTIKVLEYSHSAGNETYRCKLVNYYKNAGINVHPDEILVTTGGSEAIMFSFFVCMNAGDEVIIPEPYYANYNSFAVAAGINIIPVTSYIENGFALPPINEFEKLITKKTKAIIISNPKTICLKNDLFLLSDEAYREFCYDGEYISAMHLTEMEDHVVLLDTISKRYSATGARLGALVTKNKNIYNAAMKFAQARLSPPGLAQIMAEAGLDLPSSYFDATKEEYLSRRDLLVKRLNDMPGVFCPVPGGAFYAIAKLPIDDSDKFCQWLLESFSYNKSTLMLAPATGFYSTPGLGKNEVRIAYVLNSNDLNKAMDCLEQALLIYPHRVQPKTKMAIG
jgi:aspartate aminotransferase